MEPWGEPHHQQDEGPAQSCFVSLIYYPEYAITDHGAGAKSSGPGPAPAGATTVVPPALDLGGQGSLRALHAAPRAGWETSAGLRVGTAVWGPGVLLPPAMRKTTRHREQESKQSCCRIFCDVLKEMFVIIGCGCGNLNFFSYWRCILKKKINMPCSIFPFVDFMPRAGPFTL